MIKFIKKQLLRSWYVIKDDWSLFNIVNDTDLTILGKYLIGAMTIIVLSCWTMIVIIFLPIILRSNKE